MEQEQAASSSNGHVRQNSAQNPTMPSSSAAIAATSTTASSQDVAANDIHTRGTNKSEQVSVSVSADELSPEKINDLPSLPKESSTNTTQVAAENLINTSPWTNLSRHSLTNEMVFGPIPDREYHEGFMRKAIEMAQLALASDETPVGCVFVRDGEVIGRGINGTNASLNVSIGFFSFFVYCFEL